MVLNTALMSAFSGIGFEETRRNFHIWGRLFESAVGAHLINTARNSGFNVYYWRDRNKEVDFVLEKGKSIVAIEVKSGKKREILPGVETFSSKFQVAKKLLIGTGGLSFQDFTNLDLLQLFD